ncbi:Hypothetical predicted protein [Podarcis lilfordi]|uniref:Uncharacterized protein n=1 Tax=Podarcis lilfordi TaxID=74358 RepID=A0AA35JTK0_9SAUR|nr:Hypothetical predicted protein [Podarcis lilfordi]
MQRARQEKVAFVGPSSVFRDVLLDPSGCRRCDKCVICSFPIPTANGGRIAQLVLRVGKAFGWQQGLPGSGTVLEKPNLTPEERSALGTGPQLGACIQSSAKSLLPFRFVPWDVPLACTLPKSAPDLADQGGGESAKLTPCPKRTRDSAPLWICTPRIPASNPGISSDRIPTCRAESCCQPERDTIFPGRPVAWLSVVEGSLFTLLPASCLKRGSDFQRRCLTGSQASSEFPTPAFPKLGTPAVDGLQRPSSLASKDGQGSWELLLSKRSWRPVLGKHCSTLTGSSCPGARAADIPSVTQRCCLKLHLRPSFCKSLGLAASNAQGCSNSS